MTIPFQSVLADLSAFDAPAHWWWIGAALVLLLIETATLTLFLLWPSLAAGAVGVIAFFAPGMSIEAQFATFAGLALLLTIVGRGYFNVRRQEVDSDRPHLNRRGAQMVGRRVVAIATFDHGEGAVRVDDGQWPARLSTSDPAPVSAGETLVVEAVEGATLLVARAR